MVSNRTTLTRFWWVVPIMAALVVGLAVGLPALTTDAADHLDAPFVKTDGRVDINDLYVFHPTNDGGQNLNRTVLAMTVNPAAGVISGTRFRQDARYEFLIDTDGDARPEIKIQTKFRRGPGERQRLEVKWYEDGQVVTLANGQTDRVFKGENRSRVFAGLVDDPFFMDLGNFCRPSAIMGHI